ncbi:MAG: 3,4-dihydroxy-2-butanone-4-phosphate synthase [Spirochaetaceae bacterium]
MIGFRETRAGAVICEILGDDGLALTGSALKQFCGHHNLVSITIKDLVRSAQCLEC